MSRTCIIFYILTHESDSSLFKDVEADFRFFHFVTEEVNSTSLLSGNIIKGYIVYIMKRTSKEGRITVFKFYSYSQCFFPNSCISGSRSIRKGKFHFP